MNKWLTSYRFLIARRAVQLSLIVLFAGANYFGWKIIMGNYSSALIIQRFYLTDPHAVIQTLFSGILVSGDLIIGALLVLFFYALVGGRAFCSWVCPMNLITDLADWIRNKIQPENMEYNFSLTRKVRYWLLGLGLVLSFLLGTAAFEVINPISMLYRGLIFGFGFGWAAVLLVFLFDLLVLKNGWCGYICPLGGFYSLIGKLALIKVKHSVDQCSKCMKCIDICPESQVLFIIGKKSGQILSGECTNCGRCIEVCPDDSLRFSINKYKI